MAPLPRSFYARHALAVARDLLGCRLVRCLDGQMLVGVILEAEAYEGEDDLGCHARAGRTPRTQVMYGPPGHAYIYFTYGMHWMLNAVVEPEDQPAAVLIRAIQPVTGLDRMATLRPNLARTRRWTDGPAKLTQALALDGRQNGLDLCNPAGELFIEPGEAIPNDRLLIGPRVGLFTVPEPWKSIPWRFRVADPGSRAAPKGGS
jgi:DNA-3-methyladenine glycosylase